MNTLNRYRWAFIYIVTCLLISVISTIAGQDTDEDKTEICLQPPVIGQCRAKLPRYYYYPRRKQCEIFYYGGCDGNENNFHTKEECEKLCTGVESRRRSMRQYLHAHDDDGKERKATTTVPVPEASNHKRNSTVNPKRQ